MIQFGLRLARKDDTENADETHYKMYAEAGKVVHQHSYVPGFVTQALPFAYPNGGAPEWTKTGCGTLELDLTGKDADEIVALVPELDFELWVDIAFSGLMRLLSNDPGSVRLLKFVLEGKAVVLPGVFDAATMSEVEFKPLEIETGEA
jgi:hypothetical protein